MNDPLANLAVMAGFLAAIGVAAAIFGTYKLRRIQARLDAEREAELKATPPAGA